MVQKSIVAVVRCVDYSNSISAVARCLALLGFKFKNHSSILIKPNLLMPANPDKAVTTHPAIVEAFVESVRSYNPGAKFFLGDSPGLSDVEDIYRDTGFRDMEKKGLLSIVDFNSSMPACFNIVPAGKQESLVLSGEIFKYDYLVNFAKLKTHTFTVMTASLKNAYGYVLGKQKQLIHKNTVTSENLSKVIAEIWKIKRAELNIVDAVIGLEGDGPSMLGIPKHYGYVLASTDPVALDAVCARLMSLEPRSIPLIRICADSGIGSMDDIEIVGDPLIPQNTKIPASASIIHGVAGHFSFLRSVDKPYINPDTCKICGACFKVCPVKAISKLPENGVHDAVYKITGNCISCMCCLEMCPHSAIKLKKSLVSRAISWFYR